MYRLLLVGMENDDFTTLVNALQAHKSVETSAAASGEGALAGLKDEPVDLVVAAERLVDMSAQHEHPHGSGMFAPAPQAACGGFMGGVRYMKWKNIVINS